MKKQLKYFFLAGSLCLTWACKKEEAAPAPAMTGFWVGKYGGGSSAATTDYAFLLRPDGTMKVYANSADTAKANKGSGTYFVSGTKINGGYSYANSGSTQFSVTATTDEKFTTMSGSWGSGTSTTGNTFFMNKK